MEVNSMIFETPAMWFVLGKSETGKSFFCNEVSRVALKEKYKIIYILRSDFPIEKSINEIYEKNKNVFIIQTKDLGQNVFDYLINSFVTDSKKIIFIDNFSYQVSKEMLNLTTYMRKYNASVFFIAHTFQGNKEISPRLKECVNYFVLFWMPTIKSIKQVLDPDLVQKWKSEIKFRNYKFMIVNEQNSTHLISKLPEFKIEFKNREQTETMKDTSKIKSKDKFSFEKNIL